MKAFPILFILPFILLQAHAAPLPELGKVTITGTVLRSEWIPARRVKGVSGLSGSAGKDRTFPAHHQAVLKPYTGPNAKQATMMNAFLGAKAVNGKDRSRPPARLLVRVDSDDPDFLKPGMKITLTGYAIGGDEGGTWTSVEKIEREDSRRP
jgi:hypothetical protein